MNEDEARREVEATLGEQPEWRKDFASFWYWWGWLHYLKQVKWNITKDDYYRHGYTPEEIREAAWAHRMGYADAKNYYESHHD